MKTVVADSRWKEAFLLLATDEANELYKKFGFKQSSKLMG